MPELDGARNGAITNLGTIEIDGGTHLDITGTINNFGLINLFGDLKFPATLFIDQNAALFGLGKVVLSQGTISASNGSNANLENGSTIEGGGTLKSCRPDAAQ